MVERLQDGERQAVSDFYALYADYLAGVCSRYVVDREDKKDVFQDALVNLLSHMSDFQYRGPGSLRAWATRTVVNTALRNLRSRHQHELLTLADDDVANEPMADDEPPISDIPPDVIHQMVSSLPTGYRTVFNLYAVEHLSHQEIARLLGIKESTSASQLHHAKRLLAKMIEAYSKPKDPRQ